jgi:hypothetical protein
MPLLPVFGEQCRLALTPQVLRRRHAMQNALFTNPTFVSEVGHPAETTASRANLELCVTQD